LVVGLAGIAATRRQATLGERAAMVGALAGVCGYGVALLFHFTSPGTTPLAAVLAGVLVARPPRGSEPNAASPRERPWHRYEQQGVRVARVLLVSLFGALSLLLVLAAVAEIPLRSAIENAASGHLTSADHEFHTASSLRPWDPSIAATAEHAFAVLATLGEPGAAKRGVAWAAKAVRDDPEAVGPLEDAGTLFATQGALVKAQRDLERAKKIDPTNPQVLLALGRVELRQGQRREGVRTLETALRYAPHNADILRALEKVSI
jgi:tetratricopeptide (TPR) repeat protein